MGTSGSVQCWTDRAYSPAVSSTADARATPSPDTSTLIGAVIAAMVRSGAERASGLFYDPARDRVACRGQSEFLVVPRRT